MTEPGRRLRTGKVTDRRETVRKETGCKETRRKETGRKKTEGKTTGAKEMGVGDTGAKETGGKETSVKAMGAKETGGKAKGTKLLGVKGTGAQYSQQTGGKGDRLMGEREIDDSLPGDKTAGQNVTEGIKRKSYSEVAIEGLRRRARVFVGDSIVRKSDRVLSKGDDVEVCLPVAKIKAITEKVEKVMGSGKGGSVSVHVGTNNVDREGTPAILRNILKYVIESIIDTFVPLKKQETLVKRSY